MYASGGINREVDVFLTFKPLVNMSPGKLVLLFLLSPSFLFAQSDESLMPDSNEIRVEILADDPVLLALDHLHLTNQLEWQDYNRDTSCLNIFNFKAEEVPHYSDEVISERIKLLDANTPIELAYNKHVQAYINLYVNRKRELTSKVLGLAEFYYPMFEEKLDAFDIPLEMKHLAVVESALNPVAKSRVGATGLWQFMYTTGKIYDLEVSSYVDDRSDPYASTIAACRYFKFLYGIYGDWNMVLAAYNSGPGNVNKAIRRSGGKRTYWEIFDHLPRETRGYVPAFIAVNYMMSYHKEHNLYPVKPLRLYAEVDTVRIENRLTFEQISYYTNLSKEEISELNPSIKKDVIPATANDPHVLYLPKDKIGLFLANEDSIYLYQLESPEKTKEYTIDEVTERYRVRSGDVLGLIASRNNVSVSDIKEWNNLRGTVIHPGQTLIIKKEVKSALKVAVKEQSNENDTNPNNKTLTDTKTSPVTNFQYHTIQSGDTLWDIAKKYPGVSINTIKELNHGLNYKRLKPGQKIKIGQI